MSPQRWNPTLALCIVLSTSVKGILGNLDCDLDSKDNEGLPSDACAFNLSMKGAKPSQASFIMITRKRVVNSTEILSLRVEKNPISSPLRLLYATLSLINEPCFECSNIITTALCIGEHNKYSIS